MNQLIKSLYARQLPLVGKVLKNTKNKIIILITKLDENNIPHVKYLTGRPGKFISSKYKFINKNLLWIVEPDNTWEVVHDPEILRLFDTI